MNILTDLAENAESESVRLGATRDLLDRAGFRPVDRHEIVKEYSVEELNAQLNDYFINTVSGPSPSAPAKTP